MGVFWLGTSGSGVWKGAGVVFWLDADLGRLLTKFLAWCATYKLAWVSSNVPKRFKRFKRPRASFFNTTETSRTFWGLNSPWIRGFFVKLTRDGAGDVF